MKLDHYKGCSVEDLIADDAFRAWVKEPTPERNAFWEKVLVLYPEQKERIEKARQIVLGLHEHFDKQVRDISEQQVNQSLANLQRRVQSAGKAGVRRMKVWRLTAVAASVAILCLVGLFWFGQQNTATVYATDFGERRRILLPDSSTIELNSNSTLRFFSARWGKNDPREVWLEGEAFFDVEKKTDTGVKFIVHAGEVSVEVLGTQFNVNSRREQTQVVLAEGSIRLQVNDDQLEQKELIMQPGELAEYQPGNHQLQLRNVEAGAYSAWKDGMIIFDRMELSKALERLEDVYGVQFEIQNEELKDRPIRLSVQSDDLNMVLQTLEIMYRDEIRIKRAEKKIIIY